MYMSPVYQTILPQYRTQFGYIHNLQDGGTQTSIYDGHLWMLDNNRFLGGFTPEKWMRILAKYARHASQCIGVIVPDVPYNADKTIDEFYRFVGIPRELGYKVAFATQNGLTADMVPWDDVDVLFIGGDDQHKLKKSYPLIKEARHRGKWIHVGRVNSRKRILQFWMADSWDGTTLAVEPSIQNQRRILNASREAHKMKSERRLL